MPQTTKGLGLLRVSHANPRYFEDSTTGRIVYLTGTHTWDNLQDNTYKGVFDFHKYLDFLKAHRMNFIRLWAWENPCWNPWSSSDGQWRYPIAYMRTGPGLAADGLMKYDLDAWNEEYFERMAERVRLAGERGIYVGVMLFSGCSIGNKDWPDKDKRTGLPVKNPFDSHPYNRNNNVNGVDGDKEGTGQGWEMRNCARKDILERQKAFVRKVVDTVNRMDNVLYEILNEDPYDTRAWQYEIIHYIHEYESGLPKQHPVGMTASWKQPNEALFESPAEWVSPYYNEDEAVNPLTADGRKVWITDTDHVFPHMGVTIDFAWKAFLRGANIISMDSRRAGEAWDHYIKKAGEIVKRLNPAKESTLAEDGFAPSPGDRAQMHTRMYADRMDLRSAVPKSALSSTGYCLASPGKEYLIYQPVEGIFTVDLRLTEGSLNAEWFNPVTGEVLPGDDVLGGGVREFYPEFSPSVLYLRATQ